MCQPFAEKRSAGAPSWFRSRAIFANWRRPCVALPAFLVKEMFMLKNLSVGKRLAIGFGLIVLLLISMGLSGYWGLEAITKETLKVLNGDAKLVTLAARAKATTLELRRFEKDTFLNVEEAPVRTQYVAKWEAQRQK